MSHWNYRLIHRKCTMPGVIGHEDYYAIHEVFYDDKGEPNGVTENEVAIHGSSLTEAIECKMKMAAALRIPVLEWDDLVKAEAVPA